MAQYIFTCPSCGANFIQEAPIAQGPHVSVTCENDGSEAKRDYRAENVGVQVVALRRVREAGGTDEVAKLFLPDPEQHAHPGDPDGSKFIEKWNEEHVPADGNKNPIRPKTLHGKKVF